MFNLSMSNHLMIYVPNQLWLFPYHVSPIPQTQPSIHKPLEKIPADIAQDIGMKKAPNSL